MDSKNKDKLILGLVIAIVALLANNFISKGDFSSQEKKVSLIESDESFDMDLEEDKLAEDIEDEIIKVHISGEVQNPGVYTVKPGNRLDDLVKLAGGFTELSDEKDINLAMKLDDQMKVYIPSIYDSEVMEDQAISLVSGSKPNQEVGKININTASKEELMTLPNIGEKRAQAIIDFRENELFTDIEDIKKVTGIGEKFYEAMKDLITI